MLCHECMVQGRVSCRALALMALAICPEQEIDYKLEGENADRFRKNFAGTPWIKVPRVLWDFTAEQVGLLARAPTRPH